MSNIPSVNDDEMRKLGGRSVTSTSKQTTNSTAARSAAERDAAVTRKLQAAANIKPKKSNSTPKQQQQASLPAAVDPDAEAPFVETTIHVAPQWALSAKQQEFSALNMLGEPLRELGIKGDVVVQSAHVLHTDSTVPGRTAATVVGLKAPGERVVNGMVGTKPFTFLVSKGQHTHSASGTEIYRRTSKTDPDEFAEHMKVDVDKLASDVLPYTGKGGELKATHVVVPKNYNKDLYDIVADSTNVDSRFAAGTEDDPSFVISKADHKRIVDTYKADGGYKRASRVNPDDITIQLHHFGTAPGDAINKNAFDHIGTIPGQTQAERSDNTHTKTDHRVTAELRFVVAHKPIKATSDDDAE